jgi:hypothetical protein
MAISSDDRGGTRWAVVVCSLVILAALAVIVGLAGLLMLAVDAVRPSVDAAILKPLPGLFADLFAEIGLIILWLVLRPYFPLFGIPTEFPADGR